MDDSSLFVTTSQPLLWRVPARLVITSRLTRVGVKTGRGAKLTGLGAELTGLAAKLTGLGAKFLSTDGVLNLEQDMVMDVSNSLD